MCTTRRDEPSGIMRKPGASTITPPPPSADAFADVGDTGRAGAWDFTGDTAPDDAGRSDSVVTDAHVAAGFPGGATYVGSHGSVTFALDALAWGTDDAAKHRTSPTPSTTVHAAITNTNLPKQVRQTILLLQHVFPKYAKLAAYWRITASPLRRLCIVVPTTKPNNKSSENP